jgi:hypothetical protein
MKPYFSLTFSTLSQFPDFSLTLSIFTDFSLTNFLSPDFSLIFQKSGQPVIMVFHEVFGLAIIRGHRSILGFQRAIYLVHKFILSIAHITTGNEVNEANGHCRVGLLTIHSQLRRAYIFSFLSDLHGDLNTSTRHHRRLPVCAEPMYGRNRGRRGTY